MHENTPQMAVLIKNNMITTWILWYPEDSILIGGFIQYQKMRDNEI
jgi:hypothetical protein